MFLITILNGGRLGPIARVCRDLGKAWLANMLQAYDILHDLPRGSDNLDQNVDAAVDASAAAAAEEEDDEDVVSLSTARYLIHFMSRTHHTHVLVFRFPSIDRSITLSINRSIDRSIYHSIDHSIFQSFYDRFVYRRSMSLISI